MPTLYGVHFDFDYRGRLARNPGNAPNESKSLSQMDGFILHYGGGATAWNLGALAIWQAYARYHCQVGRFAAGVAADGLMYHCGPTFDGQKALLFDPRVTRWHAGHTHSNRFRVSINCPVGGNQDITRPMQIAIEEMMHDFVRQGVGQNVTRIWGHQEVGATACPGRLQQSTVYPLQQGQSFMTAKRPPPKPEADHVIIDVPDRERYWIIQNMFKRYAMVEEPLFVFGYPWSGMRDVDGVKVQDFERARFEWRPGSWPDRHDVLFGRVGAELAEIRYPDAVREQMGAFEPTPQRPDTLNERWFKETEMPLGGGFKRFWEAWGGLEYFGYPISREFSEDGLTIQYFERARMEWKPGRGWDPIYGDVDLGRINAELIDAQKPAPLVSLDSYIHVADPNDVTLEQIEAVCYHHGRIPVYSREKIRTIATATVTRSREFGFRTSICAAQQLHETGFYRFGGQVKPEQNNYVGLGADNTGAGGAAFPDEDAGVLAAMCHMALYVYGDVPQWPQHLRQYAAMAIRRDSVRWAHENKQKPDGQLLGYFASVERVRDYVNGRHAQTDSVPIGSLDNGYARALVRVANEVISA